MDEPEGDTDKPEDLHFLPAENFSAGGRKILVETYPLGAVIDVGTGAFWPATEEDYSAFERGSIPPASAYFERELLKDCGYERVMRETRRLMDQDFTGEVVVGFKRGVARVKRVKPRRGVRTA